uniref:GBP1 protein n=1 Tax=Fopius arisanus TaxID=64838 RepID=A0A0C9RAA3_9HYME
MSQYSSISDLTSEASSSSSPSSSEDEASKIQLYDADFIGTIPDPSHTEHTFIYDISIDITIIINQRQVQERRDSVRTALLVILGRIFHEYENWKQIGGYLMERLEEEMVESGSWMNESKNHHIYRAKVNICGHCNQLRDLSKQLETVCEYMEASFPMTKNPKWHTSRRVVYQASFFFSPALNSARRFYEHHGFYTQEYDCTNLEAQANQRCVKLYLKNILKHQRRSQSTSYDNQLAWETIFEAMKEIREDPNYELSE